MEKRGYLCYSCKEYVKEPHEHYLRMCKKCGDFNMDMRNRKADLTGYIALVTGARIKIGYQTVLKLLRYGATVIATTRFPLDAAERYSKEADFENWKDRLFLCRLDLLRVDKLDLFINYVMKSFGYIDIIINNAAQTVREHESIYHELIEKEKILLQNHKLDLDNFWDVEKTFCSNDLSLIKHIPLHKDDEIKNSWRTEAEEIGIKEFLEVQLINVTAPFILSSRLKPFFIKSPNKNRFIINVSF